MSVAVLLGLGSSLCWGIADFFGGLQSRRLSALAVALWAQLAGGLALLLVLLATGERPTAAGVAWGLGAGVFGGTALVLFYRGLAAGAMSIVAPISACGAMVPVGVAIALGEVPTAVTWVGIGAAILGVVLVSRPSAATPHLSGRPRSVLALALGAALGFGMFFVLLDQGSTAGVGSPLSVVGGARVGSLLTLLLIVAAGPRSAPWPGRRAPLVALVGVLDTGANLLFAYASTFGHLGVVAVLGSLYPVVTVALARLVLAERLAGPQAMGVVLCLAGVTLIAGG